MKNKYKAGDKVIIKDTPNVREWENSDSLVGQIVVLDADDAEKMNQKNRQSSVHINKNRFYVNFVQDDFERFIEPKFKIRERFTCTCGEHTAEIVKMSLNLKKKEFYYMLFDLGEGDAILMSESELSQLKKVEKRKIVKMTLAQVCRELGKKVEIIN